MKAFFQTDKSGEYYNVNAYVAAEGFKSLGFEIFKFSDPDEAGEDDPESVFVAGIGTLRRQLERLGCAIPPEIEYPEALTPFLGRKIWKSTLNKVIQSGETGFFIKPVHTKLFTGKVIRGFRDFIGLKYEEEVEVLCSEPVNFLTEWRCFVRYGELMDVRRYKGEFNNGIPPEIIQSAIKVWKDAPAAYGLDFGLTDKGEYLLVEVNDGHSLGTYGFGAISYAKFLSARWAEMTGTKDWVNF